MQCRFRTHVCVILLLRLRCPGSISPAFVSKILLESWLPTCRLEYWLLVVTGGNVSYSTCTRMVTIWQWVDEECRNGSGCCWEIWCRTLEKPVVLLHKVGRCPAATLMECVTPTTRWNASDSTFWDWTGGARMVAILAIATTFEGGRVVECVMGHPLHRWMKMNTSPKASLKGSLNHWLRWDSPPFGALKTRLDVDVSRRGQNTDSVL